MMNQYLLEPFLTQYFLLEAVCGPFMTEKELDGAFSELAEIFCLSGESGLKAFRLLSREEQFREIQDTASYERFCRIVEFAQKSGQPVDFTDRERTVLARKREAMAVKAELFKNAKNLTREAVSSTLTATAMNGNVDAMALLSYMERRGICVCEDLPSSLKRMRLCAKWNSLFGNLMGIAYDSEKQAGYYDTLYTVLRNASQKQVFDYICEKHDYHGSCTKNPAARILEKAFFQGAVKRNTYDPVFATAVFSQLISAEDKENILLNKPREALAALSDIPFGAVWSPRVDFDGTCAEGLPLLREQEVRQILRNVSVARDCPAEACTPLLIVASDPYVTDMYCEMLRRGFSESATVEIDCGTLTGQDFAPGRENVFLRGLAETKSARTVFLLRDCEELEEELLDELLKVLDYETRKRFKLFQPAVSMDLSGLTFVLFSAQRNANVQKLAGVCDTVWTDRISENEKLAAVDAVFAARSRIFGRSGLKMEGECRDYLAEFDTRQIQQLVDAALREAVFENLDTVTLSAVKSACKVKGTGSGKRGFGYTGGERHA